MRIRQSIAALLLVAGLVEPAGRAQSTKTDQARLIGAWRLVELDQPDAHGKIHQVDAAGLFVFTRDGHAAVQVMDRNPQSGTPAGPQQYAQNGYEASFGTYTVDPASHTFTFHIEGALVRSLIGNNLPRRYRFAGNRMFVSSTRSDELWRVVWQRN